MNPEQAADSAIANAYLEGADKEKMQSLRPLLIDVASGRISPDDAVDIIIKECCERL